MEINSTWLSLVLIILMIGPGALLHLNLGLKWGWRPLYLAILGSVLVVSLLSHFLLQIQQFSQLNLVAVLGLLNLFALYYSRRQSVGDFLRTSFQIDRTKLALILILLVGMIMRAPVSHHIYGGQDPGVYTNVGHHLANNKSLYHTNDLISQLYRQPELRSYVNECRSRTWLQEGNKGCLPLGTYFSNPEKGETFPQFLHLFPIWLAIGEWLTGPLWAGFVVLQFFSTLAIVSFYLLLRRLIQSASLSILGTLVFSANILLVWVNRYPLTETMTLSFFLAGLYLLFDHQKSQTRVILSGLLLGGIALIRGTGLITYGVLLPVYIFNLANLPPRYHLRFFLVMTTVVGYAALHMIVYSRPYLIEHLRLFLPLADRYQWLANPWMSLVLVLVLAVAGLLLRKIFQSNRSVFGIVLQRIQQWAPAVLLGMMVLLFLFRLVVSDVAFEQTSLHQYLIVTSPVLFLFSLLAVVYPKTFQPGVWFGLALLYLFFLFFQYHFRFLTGNMYLYYFGRYTVVEIYPLMHLFALFFVDQLSVRFHRARLLMIGLVMLVGVGYLLPYYSNPTYTRQEEKASHQAVATLASRIPSEANILVAQEKDIDYHTFTARLPMPLSHTFGRSVLAVEASAMWEDIELLYSTLGEQSGLYVVLFTAQPPGDKVIDTLRFRLIAADSMPLSVSEKTVTLPQVWYDIEVPYHLYEVIVD